MPPLIATPELLALLRQAKEAVEVRDTNGNIVGHFAPVTSQSSLPNVPLPKLADPSKKYSLREVYEHLLDISPDEGRKSILRKKLAELGEKS